MPGPGSQACPKPEPRKKTKARKGRAEVKVKGLVRAHVEARDGYCRLLGVGPYYCNGPGEWAHLEDKKRARTRGMPPDARHTTDRSAKLCRHHHSAYDAGRIDLEFLTARGADGPMRFFFAGCTDWYTETQIHEFDLPTHDGRLTS